VRPNGLSSRQQLKREVTRSTLLDVRQLGAHCPTLMCVAVAVAVEMAVEMAAAVAMVVVVAMQLTPLIRLILKNDVADVLSRLVEEILDSLYLCIVEVAIVRKDGAGERCNSFADSGKRVPLRLSEAF
jgi:hypothetical protein